ncbi:MAG: nuclear transport factor 2 family protein [Ferruginibacter sp.]
MILKVYKLLPLVFFVCLYSCGNNSDKKPTAEKDNNKSVVQSKLEIGEMLDEFNLAAANSEFDKYFNFFSEDGHFIGTDATENWDKKTFMNFSKPFFDKKKTWNFKSIQRNIYVSEDCNIAWFDELLNTWMKICRGSGVVVKENNQWKIKQYVLSATVPNTQIDSVIKLKTLEEDSIINVLSAKK